MGQLTLSMGPAKAEVGFYEQRATIPSKRVPHMQYFVLMYHVACKENIG
jgi:hypothetical protein